MNKFIVMGRIASDLKLQETPNGIKVCKFRIAVERNFQQKGEERKVDFFNAVAWRSTAEFLVRYFAKGRMIAIDGEMQTTEYKDKSDNKKSVWYEIVCNEIFFTGEKANAAPNNIPPELPPPEPPPIIDNGDNYPF